MRFVYLAIVLVLVVAPAGCSRERKLTVKGEGGEVTVSDKGGGNIEFETPEGKGEIKSDAGGGKMSVETPEGRVEWGTGVNVSEKDIGLPIYKSQQIVAGTSVPGKAYSVTYMASARFDDVVAFYESKLPNAEKMELSGPQGKSVTLSKKEGKEAKTVSVVETDGKVTVILNRAIGSN